MNQCRSVPFGEFACVTSVGGFSNTATVAISVAHFQLTELKGKIHKVRETKKILVFVYLLLPVLSGLPSGLPKVSSML